MFFTAASPVFPASFCVKLMRNWVRKHTKNKPIIAHLLQWRMGRNSKPSFKARINFSALSCCL